MCKYDESQNDLFENDVLFTVKGSKDEGCSTTFDKYPASNLTANSGAKYLQSVLPFKIT